MRPEDPNREGESYRMGDRDRPSDDDRPDERHDARARDRHEHDRDEHAREERRAGAVTHDEDRHEHDRHEMRERREDVGPGPRIRGGVALGPILTGVIVAFGAMFILSAILGGIILATGLDEQTVQGGTAVTVGIVAGILLVIMQFVSYMWGGYTAGRMARGAGVLNGLLVPLAALVIGGIVAGIVALLGEGARVNLPFGTTRLPIDEDLQLQLGIGIGIAMLVAMFAGGILGGILGARWHSKLEEPVGGPRRKVVL